MDESNYSKEKLFLIIYGLLSVINHIEILSLSKVLSS